MSGTSLEDFLTETDRSSSANNKYWRRDGNYYVGQIVRDKHPVALMRTCLTCTHWRDGPRRDLENGPLVTYPEGCFKYKMVPPPRVIVTGCDEYEDAWEIPF